MDSVQALLTSVLIQPPIQHGRLTVVPLTTESASHADYMLLERGISEGTVQITETSESGTVPELLLRNDALQPVLLIDGDVLTGAKQNRTLNLSIMAPPKSRISIPVSCVEAGRWSHRSHAFQASRDHMFASGRARTMGEVHRSMDDGELKADQGRVWGDIDRRMGDMGVRSPTRAMNDMFEEVHAPMDSMSTSFAPTPNQVGAIFAIDGAIVGMDVLGSPALFAGAFPRLLRSYGFDAVSGPTRAAGTVRTSEEFLIMVSQCSRTPAESPGAGAYLRLAGANVVGAALIFEDRVAHLSAFWNEKQA